LRAGLTGDAETQARTVRLLAEHLNHPSALTWFDGWRNAAQTSNFPMADNLALVQHVDAARVHNFLTAQQPAPTTTAGGRPAVAMPDTVPDRLQALGDAMRRFGGTPDLASNVIDVFAGDHASLRTVLDLCDRGAGQEEISTRYQNYIGDLITRAGER